MKFSSKNIVYIAMYNNSKNLLDLLKNLNKINFEFDILLVDDNSIDDSYEIAKKFFQSNKTNGNINFLKTNKNYGYASSQKIAYSLLTKQKCCENIIMLHGDGQYEPLLVNKFEKYLLSDYSIVHGYRDKKIYSNIDQTPIIAYFVIKLLNTYENFILNSAFKEWHSGFVMYKKEFLQKIQINELINSPHIDGNILYVCKLLKAKILAIPIYKKYNKNNNYNFFNMFKYLLSVIWLPFYFIIKSKDFIKHNNIDINYSYNTEIINAKK